jgi:hypothetical protein
MESSTPKGDSTQDSVTDLLNKLPKRIRGKIKVSETYFYNGTPCWEWTGRLSKVKYGAGYARICIDGQEQYVHILVYEILVGPVEKGLQLDHICRITWCVRYDHVEPVSQAENIRRASLFHQIVTHCKNGHEYTPKNTRINVVNGYKMCKICNQTDKSKRYYRTRIKIWEAKDPSVAEIYKARLESL